MKAIPAHIQKLLKEHANLSAQEQAEKIGKSVTTIRTYRSVMIRQGLLPRKKKQRVTPEDIERMRRLATQTGMSTPGIAECIGISKAHCAEIMLRERIKAGADAIRAGDVIALFGVSREAVRTWRSRGWLTMAPSKGDKFKAGVPTWTTRADLVRFLHVREAWPTYAPALIADAELRDIAEHARRLARGRWLSLADIGILTGEPSYTTIVKRLNAGWLAELPQTSYGRWRYYWLDDDTELPAYRERDRWARRRENAAQRAAI